MYLGVLVSVYLGVLVSVYLGVYDTDPRFNYFREKVKIFSQAGDERSESDRDIVA